MNVNQILFKVFETLAILFSIHELNKTSLWLTMSMTFNSLIIQKTKKLITSHWHRQCRGHTHGHHWSIIMIICSQNYHWMCIQLVMWKCFMLTRKILYWISLCLYTKCSIARIVEVTLVPCAAVPWHWQLCSIVNAPEEVCCGPKSPGTSIINSVLFMFHQILCPIDLNVE